MEDLGKTDDVAKGLGTHESGKRLPNQADVHLDSDSPVPCGYHRVVRTYDDLVPIAWEDVPDGEDDPEPMYLSTEAARIYMMSDREFEEYERVTKENLASQRLDDGLWRLRVFGVVMGIEFVSVVSCILVTPMDVALRVLFLCGIAALAVASWHGLRRRLEGGDQTGTSPSAAMDVLRPLRSADGVGHFAEEGMRQVAEAESKRDGLMTLVSDMFPEGSISWMRFSDAVTEVCDAIKANAMTMSEEIELAHELDTCDIRSQNPITTEMRRERRWMHDGWVTSISGTLRDNERLLFEMDKLREELLLLRQRDLLMDNEDALDEIQRLIRDTPSYT